MISSQNLLTLPYLVQREIIASMSAPEIFTLSLCSFKTFNCIQNVRIEVKKAMSTVQKHAIKMSVIRRGSENTPQLTVVLVAVGELSDSIRRRRVKLGGIVFECEMRRKHSTDGVHICQIHFRKTGRDAVNSAIYKHISSLFHGSFSAQILDTPRDVIDRPLEPVAVTDTHLDGERTNAGFLDRLFSMYPNQRSTVIGPKIMGQLKEDSELFNVENVRIFRADWTTPTILENFKGRNLILTDSRCPSSAIIKLLRKWIWNEGYQNLETILLKLDTDGSFNPHRIYREIEMREFDVIPEDLTFSLETADVEIEHTFEWQVFSNIQRRHDGKLASVCVTQTSFQFYVWK